MGGFLDMWVDIKYMYWETQLQKLSRIDKERINKEGNKERRKEKH